MKKKALFSSSTYPFYLFLFIAIAKRGDLNYWRKFPMSLLHSQRWIIIYTKLVIGSVTLLTAIICSRFCLCNVKLCFSFLQRHTRQGNRGMYQLPPTSNSDPNASTYHRRIKNPDHLPRAIGAIGFREWRSSSNYTASKVSNWKLGYYSDTKDRGMLVDVDVDCLRFRRRLLV